MTFAPPCPGGTGAGPEAPADRARRDGLGALLARLVAEVERLELVGREVGELRDAVRRAVGALKAVALLNQAGEALSEPPPTVSADNVSVSVIHSGA